MNFLISANTDIGTLKKTNQDSVLIKKIHTCQGEMVFAVLCDGMGGLEKGEVASAAVVRAFEQWVNTELPLLCGQVLEERKIRTDWELIIKEMNREIAEYGKQQGICRFIHCLLFYQHRRFQCLNHFIGRYFMTKSVRAKQIYRF